MPTKDESEHRDNGAKCTKPLWLKNELGSVNTLTTEDTMTFDEAQDTFRAKPTEKTARQYLKVAREYYYDEMIGSDTFGGALVEIDGMLSDNFGAGAAGIQEIV